MKRPVFLSLVSLLFAALPSVARACAVCLTGANEATAEAFNWSILFLMGAPYLVFGSIVGCLVYVYRRAHARRASEETAAAAPQLILGQKESGR